MRTSGARHPKTAEHLSTTQEFQPVFERETLAKEVEIVTASDDSDDSVQIVVERLS